MNDSLVLTVECSFSQSQDFLLVDKEKSLSREN
jgi:hypothetical protein